MRLSEFGRGDGSPRRSVPKGRLATAILIVIAGCAVESNDEPPEGDATLSPPATSMEAGALPALEVDPRYLDEVEGLATRPEVVAAFVAIEGQSDASLQDLIRLTEIPAPPFMEEVRAAAYAQMLSAAGADSVWIDEAGNVLALRRGTAGERTIVLEGHLDTVFPEGTDVTVTQRGDTLFAPGVGDDTRGLIAVRDVLLAMQAADIRTRGNLLFVGTVGEEGLGDLRGVKHVLRDGGPGVDAWISVDGGDEARVKIQSVGSHRFRVTFKGPGGHSWGDFGMANPHHALGRAIENFAQAAGPYTAEGPRTSFSVGRIGGGTSINSIAFESWMEVDMRSVDTTRLAGIDSIFRTAVATALEDENAARRSGEPLTVDVMLVGDRPAGNADPDSPLIQRAAAATRVLGGEPEASSSSTNANYPMYLGIPATTIGRGGEGGDSHALTEWWLPSNEDLAVKKALLLVLAEAGLN